MQYWETMAYAKGAAVNRMLGAFFFFWINGAGGRALFLFLAAGAFFGWPQLLRALGDNYIRK